MANRSNNQEDQFRQLRYLPPIPPRSSNTGNRYTSAAGPGFQSYQNFPARGTGLSYSDPFFVRSRTEQEQGRDQGRYSMRYAEEGPRSRSSRGIFESPYSASSGSPSSGSVPGQSTPATASNRRSEVDDISGYLSGTTTQASPGPGHTSSGTLSPFTNTTGSGSGSRLGQEHPYPYPCPYPAPLHAPRPIHPPTTLSMQLEYVLNRSGRRSSAASSPLSGLPSSQESKSHYSSPTLHHGPSSSSWQGHTSSGSDTLSLPPAVAVSTSGTENGNDNSNSNSSTISGYPPHTEQTPESPTIRTEFEEVSAHTAKCDLCNNRNDSGMSRCLSCGWQSCHACTITNGCTRTHNAGSRVHTGPVEQSLLLSTGSLRGRGKRSRAPHQPRREEEDLRTRDVTRPTRMSKRQCARDQKRSRKRDQEDRNDSSATASTPTSPLPPPPDNEGSFSPTTADDMSETEKALQGARDLYAFSIEAWGEWAHEQQTEYQNQQGKSNEDAGIENLHSYAQDTATRALEEYKRREVERENGW